ncbi:MAG: repeat-containing protein [Desulfomicrobiaceae bacterium]|nr:repeat-containing protein [Desulfomicrobiaceae bacterium]
MLPIFLCIFLCFGVPATASATALEDAIAQYRAENYEEALEILQTIPESGQHGSVAAFYLGLTYKQTGELRKAATFLERSLRLTPRVNDAYTELTDVLLALGDTEKAARILDEAEGAGIRSGALMFLRGLVLARQGKAEGARHAFAGAKAMDPRLAPRADLQLAMLDVSERRYSSARQTLQAITNIAPDTEIAEFARQYDTALANLMSSHKTWRYTAGLQYQYDDNVILKPTDDVPGGISSRQSDSAMVGTLRAEFSPLIEGPWSFLGQLTATGVWHETINSRDLTSLSLSLIPGRSLSSATLVTLPVTATHAWLDGQRYSITLGVRPTLLTTLVPGHLLQAAIGINRRDLIEAPLMDDENRDGVLGTAALAYLKPLDRGGLFTLGLELSRDETRGVNWRNTGYRPYLSLLYPLTQELSALASGDAFLQDYDGEHTVFEKHRRDEIYTGSLGLIWRPWDWGKFSLQYTHVEADSTIAIYEYTRNLYTLGFEATF